LHNAATDWLGHDAARPRRARTDFRPLRLTVTYHPPRQQQAHCIGKRLIAA